MPERKTGYDPRHPNANIHGMIGPNGSSICETRNGKMCTGCCQALNISEQDNEQMILKSAGERCDAQIPIRGCRFVLEGTPEKRYWVCPVYHCSSDRAKVSNKNLPTPDRIAASQRLVMENTVCLHHGEIDQATYRENLKRIPNP